MSKTEPGFSNISPENQASTRTGARPPSSAITPAAGNTQWRQLRESYTNSPGQMVCQICEEEMPFRKRDGQHYFEAVEALNTPCAAPRTLPCALPCAQRSISRYQRCRESANSHSHTYTVIIKNIALSVDENVLAAVRRHAAERNSTVNALVREFLTGLTTHEDRRSARGHDCGS